LAPQQALDEVRIADLFAQPQRHGGDLGVEHRMRRPPGQIVDDFDILAAGMEDLQHFLIVHQQVEQGCQVDPFRFGIDRRGLLLIADLHQAEVGPEGIFAHELGVHGDEFGKREAVTERTKRFGVGNQGMNLHLRPS
jgi:hypothetical protein